MKIFIICCLLFIHVNMCIFIRGFRVSIRVSGIRGFGFGDGFPPESVSGSGSGFDFGFRFWVHGDSTRSKPDPLPSLSSISVSNCDRLPVIRGAREQNRRQETQVPIIFWRFWTMHMKKHPRIADFQFHVLQVYSVLILLNVPESPCRWNNVHRIKTLARRD